MISTIVFVSASLSMLVRAFRTKDLSSYSLSSIAMWNIGNGIHWLYVVGLPFGPLWFLHGFYTLAYAMLLLWYLRYERWAHAGWRVGVKTIRDWQQNRAVWIRVLEEGTGENLETWNRRIRHEQFCDEQSLRAWLTQQDVTGYAQSLLVMERFGYPDFMTTSADNLIAGQYADRPQLRPIFDAIIHTALEFPEVVIQARKTYVSLVTPRRTFARVQPTTKTRLDLGLRLQRQKPGGRLQPSKLHATMTLQIGLASVDQVDTEVVRWLRQAYDENS